MATDTAEEVAVDPAGTDEITEEAMPGGKFGLNSKRLKLAALLVVVMSVQAAVFYWWVPRAGGSGGTDGDLISGAGGNPDNSSNSYETVESEVGKFSCTNSIADPGATIHINFELVVVVAEDQQAEFENLATDVHKNRIRQAVLEVARSANLDELSDPSLSTIKRRIGEEINKALDRSYVRQVIISDYSRMEQ